MKGQLLEFGNGPTLLHYEMPQVRSVAMGLFVCAGSVYETAENNGISHFTEHATFKGTKKRTPFDIVADTDNIGAALNAFTGKTSTCYYVQCVDGDADKSAEILSDIFFDSTYPSAELEKERGVILEEISMSVDNPDDLSYETATQAFFEGHPAARPVLGTRENVSSFGTSDVLEYRKANYSGKRAYLSVAGNITADEAARLTEKYFLRFPGPGEPAGKIPVPETNSVFAKEFKDTEQANINLIFPSFPCGDGREEAAAVFNRLFGYGMSGRLYQTIRERMGLAYSVYSVNVAYPFAGFSDIYLGTSPEHAALAVRAVRKEIDTVKKDGISEEELERGKAQILSGFVFGSESSASIMTAAGRYAVSMGGLFDLDERIERIRAVTMDDVREILETAFDPDRAAVGYVGPETKEDLLAVLKDG